ncbi:hypothetical protein AZE42_11687 [Rhizopogon vesiculosus]|uniref:Ricin B lectin domain-containing protein n=1 Tax=Rhizopogon vesiculosus TaxID=180088 RepID=A0A1J8QN17_9AGAM|nr:hypothetical protein AZE42_11687 [Rhizopogon vesiculosus]
MSRDGCTATILGGENVLRGEPIESATYYWNLKYVPGTQKKLCYFEDPKSPGTSLGVNSVQTHQAIYRLGAGEGTSIWEIKKTEDGFTLSTTTESDGKEYFWYLGNAGEPIIIADESMGIQSWMFQSV